MKKITIFIIEKIQKCTKFLIAILPVFAVLFLFSQQLALADYEQPVLNTEVQYRNGVETALQIASGTGISHINSITLGTNAMLYWGYGCTVGAPDPLGCAHYSYKYNGDSTGTYNGIDTYTYNINSDVYGALIFSLPAYNSVASGTNTNTDSNISIWDTNGYNRGENPIPYFKIIGTGGQAKISLYAPNSTIPDFSNWSVSWSGDLPVGTMYVYYGQSTTTMTLNDSVSFSPYVSSSPLPIHKTHLLWYVPLSVPSTWYAEAVLMGSSTAFMSDIMTFSIDPNAGAPSSNSSTIQMSPFSIGGGDTSSTIANPTTNCAFSSSSFTADPLGNIENGICSAFAFLFIPNGVQQQNIGNSFANEKNIVLSKPPFGYAVKILDAFNSFSISSSTTSTLMSASGTAIFASTFITLDVGIACILSLLFAWYIVHRIKKLEI